MDVCLLIGKSGSGKSTNSVKIAKKYGVDYVVDDGLLLRVLDGVIICGQTAKSVEVFDQTLLDIAIFEDKKLSLSMQEAIKQCNPAKIMILALDLMVGKDIANNLGLKLSGEIINIVDELGKHAVEEHLNKRKSFRHGIPGSPSQVIELIQKINKQMSGQYIITNVRDNSTEVMYVPATI